MLLLGSGSPRRRELLGMLDIPFEIVKVRDVDETYPEGMEPEKVPEYLSRLKAGAYRDELSDGDILLTADTVVILDGDIIGKPADEADARRMLARLSGKKHKVVTGVTLTSVEKSETFSVETEVEFAPLSETQIDYYVEKYRPLDKAGAYGIQEWIGAVGIVGVNGSFYNVMGLPVMRLYNELRAF